MPTMPMPAVGDEVWYNQMNGPAISTKVTDIDPEAELVTVTCRCEPVKLSKLTTSPALPQPAIGGVDADDSMVTEGDEQVLQYLAATAVWLQAIVDEAKQNSVSLCKTMLRRFPMGEQLKKDMVLAVPWKNEYGYI